MKYLVGTLSLMGRGCSKTTVLPPAAANAGQFGQLWALPAAVLRRRACCQPTLGLTPFSSGGPTTRWV